MEHIYEESSPALCASLGLDCRSCVQKNALCLAHICTGLSAEGLLRTFQQMYPSTGCRPMAHVFQSAYLETESGELAELAAPAAA